MLSSLHFNGTYCLPHCKQMLSLTRRLLDVVGDNTPLQDAFLLADDVLRQVRASLMQFQDSRRLCVSACCVFGRSLFRVLLASSR